MIQRLAAVRRNWNRADAMTGHIYNTGAICSATRVPQRRSTEEGFGSAKYLSSALYMQLLQGALCGEGVCISLFELASFWNLWIQWCMALSRGRYAAEQSTILSIVLYSYLPAATSIYHISASPASTRTKTHNLARREGLHYRASYSKEVTKDFLEGKARFYFHFGKLE